MQLLSFLFFLAVEVELPDKSGKAKDSKSHRFNPMSTVHTLRLSMTRLNTFQMSAEPVILFPFLFFFLPPSLPSIPALHTPCHSSADGRSDTWTMQCNQRDSWPPSRGELLQNAHAHTHIQQQPCVQAYTVENLHITAHTFVHKLT